MIDGCRYNCIGYDIGTMLVVETVVIVMTVVICGGLVVPVIGEEEKISKINKIVRIHCILN